MKEILINFKENVSDLSNGLKDYALVKWQSGERTQYVVAYGLANKENGELCWSSGNYCETLEEGLMLLMEKTNQVNKTYDYVGAVKEDIEDFFEDEQWEVPALDSEDFEKVYDTMMLEDSITGSGSGSYTFNKDVAKQNLINNEELIADTFRETELSFSEVVEKGAEFIDVAIREHLVRELLIEVINEKQKEQEEDIEL